MKRFGTDNVRFGRRGALAAGLCTIFAGVMTTPQGGARGATVGEIKQRGYMIVATEDDYPPFEFVKDGQPQGLDNELFELLKKSVPFELRRQIIPFQGLLAGVSTGKFDLALTAALVTAQRAESLDFTIPIAEGTYYYVKRKGDDRLKSIRDLSGKTVGVQQGSALEAALPDLDKKIKQAGGSGLGSVITYASYPEAYEDLANGRTDYVINTIVTVASLVRERPNVFAMGGPVSGKSYHAWAVKRGNDELLRLVNGFLAEQRKNGTMVKLQEKWLGTSFPDLPDQPMLPGDRPIPR
jgi:polar amino acid transport system substrate-binding protein